MIVLTRFVSGLHIYHYMTEPYKFLKLYMFRHVEEGASINCVHIHHEEDIDEFRHKEAHKRHYNEQLIIREIVREYEV